MEPEAYDELFRQEPGHWWYQGMRLITARLLRGYLPRQERLRILDAGCGVGGNLDAFADFGNSFGIDYSPLALAYAAQGRRGRIGRASVEHLPFPDGAFDLVTSFEVLYAREVQDDTRALREFARVLRPGGYLLVRLPALLALRGAHDVVVHGVRRYTARGLRGKVLGAGLVPIRLTYLNFLLMPLIFVIRQFQNLQARRGAAPASDVKPTHPVLNRLLRAILALEAAWLGRGHSFPAGVSVLCLARKPLAAEAHSQE
jgi:SAM-dependent methyltransferase